MKNCFLENEIELEDIYEGLPSIEIPLERKIYDFSLAAGNAGRLYLVWSEYKDEKSDEVNFYSRVFDGTEWQEVVTVDSGKQFYPDVELSSGYKGKIYLLLGKMNRAFDQLLLKVCDQDNWEPGKNIIDVESHIFGYKIIASRKRQQVFLVFGDYRERHYFPYIITAILSGHVGEKFGKLYLLEGDGESWGRPLKITKEGRFSCSSPQICLNDGMKHVHLVWEDARRGYNRKAIFYDSFRENGFGGNRKVSGGLTRADTFAPAIACDDVDNLYIAWSTFEGDNVGKLYFRQRIKNQWSESTALAEKSVLSSLTIDNSSNIHLVWENGYNVFYKINCKSSWTKTKKFEGQRAEMCVDKENNVHLLIVRYRNIEDYKFVHHVFKFRR